MEIGQPHHYTLPLLTLLIALCTFGGCEKPLARPEFNPGEASKLALSQYDANGDGQIDKDELKIASGLQSALSDVDIDGDKAVTGDEVSQRIEYYKASPSSVAGVSFVVTYKRKPLSGATVTLEPEPFMGENFPICTSVSDDYGSVTFNRPDVEEGGFPGVYLGMYKVKVSKQENGKETIPAKYNENTTLGLDSGKDHSLTREDIRFDLK